MADERGPEADPLDWSDLERQLRAAPPRHDAVAGWAKLERAMDDSAPAADVRPFRDRPLSQPQSPSAPLSRPGRERFGAPRFAAPNWAARVAAVLVLGGAGMLTWRMTRPAMEAVAPAAMREVATARGQRATVRLADGTRVELGVGSKLRYAEFGAGSRDVSLEGEAYFDVVHDTRRPFVVHTARAVARDLGTKFNVRGYADASEVEVVVAEGAVALSAGRDGPARDTVLLRAGDLGRIEADGRLVARRGVDVAAHLAWIEGRLVFNDTPLRDAVPRLAYWYGAEVRLGDSTIAGRRYTASLQSETFGQVLDLMARSLELRVEREAGTVVLYGRSAARPPSPAR